MKSKILKLIFACLVMTAIAIPSYAADLIVDDFEDNNLATNLLGGIYGATEDTAKGDITPVFLSTTVANTGNYAMTVKYGPIISWSVVYQKLNSAGVRDLSGYDKVEFYIKGSNKGEIVKLQIADKIINRGAENVANYIVGGSSIAGHYQKVSIPLSKYSAAGVDLTKADEMNFVFDTPSNLGQVNIDDVKFIKPTTTGLKIVIDDLEDGNLNPNTAGGQLGTIGIPSTAISIYTSTDVKKGMNALKLTHDAMIAGDNSGIFEKLNNQGIGIDITAYSDFNFWAKGINGGENLKIEIVDASDNRSVKFISDLGSVLDTNWKEITIPLTSFSGTANLSNIKEVNILQDGVNPAGGFFVDQIQLVGPPVTPGQGSIVVTVQNYALSVAIIGSINFNTLTIKTTAYSSSAITVTNNGNVPETFWVNLIEPAPWTSGFVPGNDRFVLFGQFSSALPILSSWLYAEHIVLPIPSKSTDTKFKGSYSGANVPVSQGRDMWFKIQTPTQTSDETAKNIYIVVTASAQ